MIDLIKKAFKDVFTERDGETLCPVRVGSGLAGMVYHAAAVLGFSIGDIHLDINTLGTYLQHMVLLIGVGGATVGAKSLMKGDAQ